MVVGTVAEAFEKGILSDSQTNSKNQPKKTHEKGPRHAVTANSHVRWEGS